MSGKSMKIEYTGGKQFSVSVRNHTFLVDQPESNGGKNDGPTPPEFFMASLGTCIGVYVASYCNSKGINCNGLTFDVKWSISDEQEKIDKMEINVIMPDESYKKREKAILRVAEHCLIHNTIHGSSEIKIGIKAK